MNRLKDFFSEPITDVEKEALKNVGLAVAGFAAISTVSFLVANVTESVGYGLGTFGLLAIGLYMIGASRDTYRGKGAGGDA